MSTKVQMTGRESDKFMLRLPDGMRDLLKEAARSNNRTMNAEIVARLQASFGIKNLGNLELFAKPSSQESGPDQSAGDASASKTADVIFERHYEQLLASIEAAIRPAARGVVEEYLLNLTQTPPENILVGNLGTDRPSIYEDVKRQSAEIPNKRSNKGPRAAARDQSNKKS